MGPSTVMIYTPVDQGLKMLPVSPESNKTMKFVRPWYLLPFLVNLALIYSASYLIPEIDKSIIEESTFSMSSWIFFATIAVISPTCLSFTRLLPDPSISLAIGGLLTAVGLLWSWFESGPVLLISFGLLTGTGLSLSLQSVCTVISPYFNREKPTATALILLVSTAVMIVLNPLMAYLNISVSTNILLYFCGAVLTSSLVPVSYYVYSIRHTPCSKTDSDIALEKRFEYIFQEEGNPEKMNHIGFFDNVQKGVKNVFVNEGWIASVISVCVWLSWGAGVDSTWLTMGWHFQYFTSPSSLAALQLFLCLLLLFVKVVTEHQEESTPSFKVNLASNYMHLGLLGAAGVVLCLFPEHTQSYHNHLLFTMSFALQYDDLSDLCLVSENRTSLIVSQYQLVKYHIGMNMQGNQRVSFLRYLFCLMCHLISLLLMSFLAMIVGVHFANILGILSTVPPLSFLCTRAGLLVLSVTAVSISLTRPGSWIGKRHRLIMT